MGLLWLTLGIFLLSALLATVEKLEKKIELKKSGEKDNKATLS